MKFVFWTAAIVIAYTYFGYAAWLWLRSRWAPWPVLRGVDNPTVSIVMVVRNEAEILERKLKNLLSLDYPQDMRELVVVSDGSTDGTNEILSAYSKRADVRALIQKQSRGKAAGLNDALAAVDGDIVMFTDVRQIVEPDALRLLANAFVDPAVGCVSGELMLGDPASGESSCGMGLYWRIEKKVREWESASGSVVGATGAIYAVRRDLVTTIPLDTILDDVYIPMQVVRQGSRVIFDPRARAWDLPDLGKDREFRRKVRTLSGNYQLVQLAPWLLGKENPLRFEFVSHKLIRLIAPLALLIALLACCFLRGAIYRVALVLQIVFYCLSLLAMNEATKRPFGRIGNAASTFVVLNTAAAVAFGNFITGRKAVWIR